MMNDTNAPDSEVNADNGPPCLEALPKFTLAVGDFQLQQQSVDGGLASLGTFHDPDENDLARLISPPGGADLWGISRYASPIIMNSNDGSPLEPPAQREKDYLVSQASSLSIIDKNSAPESKRRPLEERARWFLPMTMTLSYCIPALITASKKGGNTSASDVDSLITSDQVNQSFRELKKCLWPRQNCHLQSPMSSCPVEPFGDEGSSSTNSSVLNTKKNCEKEPQKRRSLRLAILLSISGDYWALVACVISSACQFVMVALLDWVTEFVSNEDEAHWHGYGYAALALFLSVTQSVAKAQIGRASGHMQAKLHGSIAMLMMERLCDETPKGSISSVLEVASNAGENSKTAKFMEEKSVVVDEYINEEDSPVVQLLTSDVEAIAEMVPMLLFGAVNMLDIVIAFTYLLVVVGWPGLCPIAVFILLVPANKFISDRFVDSYDDKSTAADARSRKVEEVLSYIRTIKYYAWEAIMERDISALRNTEVKVLKGLMGYLMAFSGIVAVAAPLMQLSLFVAIYFGPANEGRLDGSMIYQCIALISTASWHLSIVPYEVSEWSRVSVAVRRVERFLFSLTTAVNDLDLDDDALDEVGEDQQMNPDAEFPKPTNAAAVGTVDLQHVSFIHQAKASVTYSPSGEPTSDNERSVSSPTQNFKSDAFIVRVPQLSIQPGELAMIVGKVGSGKSSLASAVMGQMCPIQSAEFCQRFDVSGRISIVPQTPWILNGTVRNNIILGSEFNDDRYKKVLRASALALDLSLFSNGDATVVGPKGATLSGGQRQRISIARALYREADIYIFDDSLSALDAAVGRQVFESAIKEFLSTKTRILVTHQLSYLPLADKIVVVSDGCVTQAQLPEFVAIEPEENEEPIAELLRGWRFVLDALETSQATNNTANVHLNSSTNDESVGLPTHHGSFDVTTPIRRTTLTPAAAAQIYQSSRAVGAPFTLEGGDGQREEILIGEASVTHLPAPAVLSPSNIHIPNVLSCAPSGETSPQLTFATESHPVSPSRGTLRLPTFAILGAIGKLNLDNET